MKDPMTGNDKRDARTDRSRVTDTGWRLVGAAASLLDSEVTMNAGPLDDCIFATRFRLRPWLGRQRPLGKTLEVIGRAITREWPDAPPLSPDRTVMRPPARFHGVHWQTDGSPGAWMGELHWRYPHPVVKGVACQLHAVLVELEDVLTMTVRVFVAGGAQAVRGHAGVGQARPRFLSELNRDLRLTFEWGDTSALTVAADSVNRFVTDTLLGDSRDHAVAVLAPLEDGSYVVPPDVIADELLGLCQLYVIDQHQTTFRLTDALGDKRLSCFWGALRVYMPDFSCASPPLEHPLLIRDWLEDPVLRAELVGRLALMLGDQVPVSETITERRNQRERRGKARKSSTAATEPPAIDNAIVAVVASLAVTGVEVPSTVSTASRAPGSDLTGIMLTMADEIRALASAVQQLSAANRDLREEVIRLRTASAVRASSASAVDRQLERIDRRLATMLAVEPAASATSPHRELAATAAADAAIEGGVIETDQERATLVDVVRQATGSHADTLLFLDSAERAATDSPFEDVERVAAVLDAMAEVARRRQNGGLGMSVRDAFRDYGIDYRGSIAASTPERQRSQYLLSGADGETYECHEHLVLGSTYDPRYCLRIYFTSRAPLESRFVIGHVGRHFEVITTT